MAAGRAGERDPDVTVLERGPSLARKLRISGKSRGNITNTADLADFIEAFGPNGRFLYGAFSRFFRDDLLRLLGQLGVPTKTERGGRVFPASDRAEDVAAALERWIKRMGVVLTYGAPDVFSSGGVNALRTLQDAYTFSGARIVGMVYGTGGDPAAIAKNAPLLREARQLGRDLVAEG